MEQLNLDLLPTTKQEMFDRAVAGLASQGFQRATDEFGQGCMYRAKGGLKCALGHCIPDALYTTTMESRNAASVLHDLNVGDEDFRSFAVDLQQCHDRGFTPEKMKAGLRILGEWHNLVIPEVLREVAQ